MKVKKVNGNNIEPPAPQNVRKMPLHPATKKAWIRQYGKTHNPDGTPKNS